MEHIDRRTGENQLAESAESRFTGRCHLTFGDGEGGAPLVTQNVETYAPVGIDVGVIDSSCEIDLWWFEWIIGRKVYC